jgi:hypothetical protein
LSLDGETLRLRAEIAKLKRELVDKTKIILALRNERDEWRKKFEQLSVTKLKTVRIKVNGDDH